MPTFRVESAFQIPERSITVLGGDIVEGVIRPGMILLIPLNSQLSVSVPIDSIELASTANGSRPCLCIRGDPAEREHLLSLNFVGETLEVVDTAQQRQADDPT